MTSNNEVTANSVKKLLDQFLNLSSKLANTQPVIVVMLMHEYFRNMYPNDPYIKSRYAKNILMNIYECLQNNIEILKTFEKVGSYPNYIDNLNITTDQSNDDIERMSNLFGSLWKKRYNDKVLDSQKVINDLFSYNSIDLPALIKNKNVIDIGCGSGRFAISLAQLGAKKVTAIDINTQGLNTAKSFSKESRIKNIEFVEHNVLDLPFEDESFDFVFSKGVLHHTGNLEKGINEYSRVLKKNGHGFLYLYANGGIYWESRKKMREVMQLIPMDLTIKVLDLIGMPARRTIFVDSWYVPVEDYVTSEFVHEKFSSFGYKEIKRMKSNRPFELDKIVLENNGWAEDIWGEGELRYFLTK